MVPVRLAQRRCEFQSLEAAVPARVPVTGSPQVLVALVVAHLDVAEAVLG